MIIVPHEIVAENESVAKYMSDLDKEMLTIANDNSIPIDAKVIQYNQILRRHQTARHKNEKPFKLEVQSEAAKAIKEEKRVEKTDTNSLLQTIMHTVPVKFHKQANLLFDYAQGIPGLKWSDKGEMIVDGNKIVGTNIVDLINDLSRNRSSDPPTGVDLLIKKLYDQNVPKELILDKKRLSIVNKDIFASPQKTPGPGCSKRPLT